MAYSLVNQDFQPDAGQLKTTCRAFPLEANRVDDCREDLRLSRYSPVAPDNTTLQPVPLPIPGESNAAYKAAIVLVAEIDRRLERGGHYRIAGRRCTTLDEAVEALLEELKTT